jgi:hypothetical protein
MIFLMDLVGFSAVLAVKSNGFVSGFPHFAGEKDCKGNMGDPHGER